MTPTTLTPSQEFLLSLERERFNVAYRRPADPVKVEYKEIIRWHTKPCNKAHVKPAEQEKRDQIMFNAGRYAAGARDEVAVNAFDDLQKLLEEN